MAPICVFRFLQNIAKLIQNDLLALKMVFTEPQKTEENTFNFSIFVEFERKTTFMAIQSSLTEVSKKSYSQVIDYH